MAIIVLPNCTMLYYVFSGPLSLPAYVPEIKFNNNNNDNYCKPMVGRRKAWTELSSSDMCSELVCQVWAEENGLVV